MTDPILTEQLDQKTIEIATTFQLEWYVVTRNDDEVDIVSVTPENNPLYGRGSWNLSSGPYSSFEEAQSHAYLTQPNTKQPAAPAKIHGYLVPNRHDRRRAAAKARRKSRKK